MEEPSQTKGVNGLQPLVQVIRPTRRRRAETEWAPQGLTRTMELTKNNHCQHRAKTRNIERFFTGTTVF